jgi:phosphohistidine phosphatase
MWLYLVQHGEATSEEEDPERPLSERGVVDVHRVARKAAESGIVTAVRVVHSGKTRARQTADAWGHALGVPVDHGQDLLPRADASIWAMLIAGQAEDLMLVGHLPHLAELAGLLLTGDKQRTIVAFQQGGLVGLEQIDGRWSVSLVLPPGVV